MKKSLLAIAFAMVAMVSSAQIYVGGSLDVNFEKSPNISNFNFAPEVGYVINENFSAGATLDLDFQWNKGGNGTIWAFVPYARYTFLQSGKFSCFVDGVLSISGRTGANAAFGIYAQPGIAYSVTEKISLVSKFGKIGWDNNAFTINAHAVVGGISVYYTF